MKKRTFLLLLLFSQLLFGCKSSNKEIHLFKLTVNDTWTEFKGYQKPDNIISIELRIVGNWVEISEVETKPGSNYSTISCKLAFEFSKPIFVEHDDETNIYEYRARVLGGELEHKVKYIQGPDYEGFVLLKNNITWNFFTDRNDELRELQKKLMSHQTHNNAIQSVESGTDLRFIQELLEHRNAKIAGIYTYISTKNIRNIKVLLMIQRKKKSYFMYN